jgi:citrate synthase
MADQAKTSDQKSKNGVVKAPGLKGVVALESELSFIDGETGELVYRGYDIRDLAKNASFEEVVYLMWNGRLPTQNELEGLHKQLQAARAIPAEIIDFLRQVPEGAHPMAVLRTAVSALAHFDEETEDTSVEANKRKAIRLLARMPACIAAFARLRGGKEPVAPLDHGSTAHNFLYMLNGEEPGEAAEETFDVCLVLHADHGLNASTFTARVIGSTLSDMYSSLAGAIGALKGPLHGGANVEVMKMLKDVHSGDRDPVQYVTDRLAANERIMGFGHRVYRTMDPRASILKEMVEALSEERDARHWYEYQMQIMETMKSEKNIDPNVDFFSASVYYMLGIDIDLFTTIFALSRTTGWTAHLLEQWSDNSLIRPRAEYVGPKGKTVTPIAERS